MNGSSSAWIPIGISIVALVVFIGFIILGIMRFSQEQRRKKELKSKPRGYFVFAKILDSIAPMERGVKYEKPLNAALQAVGFGEVTGGGSQISRDNSHIEWIGVDIELSNLEGALAFTCKYLLALGAPSGSVLEYRIGEQKMTVQIA